MLYNRLLVRPITLGVSHYFHVLVLYKFFFSLCCYRRGVYGLWLDGDLYHGRTQPCLTYDNDLLTVAEDFMIQCLEVWKFV